MDMVKVESSNLDAVGYDEASGEMTVRFKGGGVYRYSGVPKEVHRQLMEAESKGSFMAKSVARNPAYPVVKVPPVVAEGGVQ